MSILICKISRSHFSEGGNLHTVTVRTSNLAKLHMFKIFMNGHGATGMFVLFW